MAPRKSEQLDLSLSKASQASMDAFNAKLVAAEKAYIKLVDLAKKLADTQKAINAQAALADLDGFNRGRQVQANRRTARTFIDGTARGAELGNEKERALVADKLVKSGKEQVKNQEALALNVQKTLKATKDLTDTERLKGQLKLAERRLGLELAAGDSRRISAARSLVKATQDRLAVLQQEQALLRENERLRITRNKPVAAPLSTAENAARSRTLTNERLFGDGGANLLRIQTGLAANYMLLNAIRGSITESITFAKELDSSLRNLQAIVVITDSGLAQLRDTFIEVASNTKFSAVEISNAAVILGQAGLSVAQIKDAIGAVALLATASGTDLAASVALTTSVLGVFNLEAGQTTHVANALTEAVNSSKLDIEKLALALQYSGNTAAEVGINFEELTAAVGAMSNAGIRSGSTLGTGMRQILISLQKPSAEFIKNLTAVGLTMADVDVRTFGLYGVMKNLADAGFTASDAMKSFEVRGAAAYAALSRNLDQMLEMESSLYDTAAASRANETQMRSLENQSLRFRNSLHALIASGMEPLLFLTRDVFQGLGDLLGSINLNGTAVKVLVTGMVSLVTVGVGVWLVGLTKGLFMAAAGSLALRANLQQLITGFAVARTAAGGFAATMGLLSVLSPVLLGLAAVVGLTTVAWSSYANELARAEEASEKARAQLETTTGEVEAYAAQISTVDTKLATLHARSELLNKDQKLMAATTKAVKNEFADMGLDVLNVVGTVDGLIAALTQLRENLSDEYIIKLRVQQEDMASLESSLQGQKNAAIRSVQDRTADAVTASAGIGDAFVDPDRLFARANVALQDDPSTEQLQVVQREIQKAVGDLLAAPEANSTGSQFVIDVGNKMLEDLKTAITASQELDRIGLDMAESLEAENTARSVKTPEFQALQTRLLGLRAEMDQQVREISTNMKGNAVGAASSFSAAMDYNEERLAGVEAELEALVATGNITQDAADILGQVITESRVRMEEIEGGAIADARPVREFEVQSKVDRLEAERSRLQENLQKLTSFSGFDSTTKEIFEVEAAYNQAVADQVALMNEDASVGEQQAAQAKAKLDELIRARETQAAVLAKRQSLTVERATQGLVQAEEGQERLRILQEEAALQAIIARYGQESAQADNFRLSQARAIYAESLKSLDLEQKKVLLAQFDKNNPRRSVLQEEIRNTAILMAQKVRGAVADYAAAGRIVRELNKQAEMQRLIKVYGEDSLQVQRARAEEERAVFAASLETLNVTDATKASMMEVWDQTNGVTGATWGWADAMAGVLGQINGILGALSAIGGTAISIASKSVELKALKAGKTAAQAVQERQRFEIDREAASRSAAASSWVEKGLIFIDKKLQHVELKQDELLVEARANAPTPKGSAGGGDGGGGGGGSDDKAKDAFELFMSSLENNFAAALVAEGPQQEPRVRQILDTARSEADRRAEQIKLLQGQDLSAAKQKDLNRLVEEHGSLLAFISATEEKIVNTKNLAHLVQFDLNKQMANWAAENLNMMRVLEQGVGGFLSGFKGALTGLFTDLSNGTKTGKQAFRDFAIAAVQALQSIVVEMLAVYAMKKLLGWAADTFDGGGSFFADLLSGLTGANAGGSVNKMSGGGPVQGNLPRDSVPALLMPDEYVIRATAARAIGVEELDRLNNAGSRRMTGGGGVAPSATRTASGQPLNIWMAPPDQRPIPGPSDIIAVVSQDMLQGGTTKRLIKSIQRGQF